MTLPTDYVGSDDTEDVDHAGMHNDVNAAVNAIEAELGTNPSGASATVVARLDALDATVAGKESSGTAATAVAGHEADPDPHSQYATDSALTSGLAGKAASVHSHVTSDVTGLDTALAGKAAATHSHVAADVTDLGDAALFDVGTTAGTVAAGDHAHSGVYDAAGTAAALVDDLSGVSDAATARTNLGLGSAAVAASGDFEAAGSAVLKALVDAKGDLLVGTAADTVGRLAVGTDGHVLTADSAQASGVKWAAAGGSSTGVVHYVSGTGAPSAGLGSTADWAVNDNSVLYRKISGTWTSVGRLNNFAQAFVTGGWTLAAGRVTPPNAAHSSWVKTNLAAQSGNQITFAGSSANASAVLSFPASGRFVDSAFARFAVNILPVGGPVSFGLGVTPFSPPWPLVNVSTAGVVTISTGGGTTLKTLSGTCAASDQFLVQMQPGAVLIGWADSGGVAKDQFLYASNYVSRANLADYGAAIHIRGTGTLTAGVVSFIDTEVIV